MKNIVQPWAQKSVSIPLDFSFSRGMRSNRDSPTTSPHGAHQAGPHDQQTGPRGV